MHKMHLELQMVTVEWRWPFKLVTGQDKLYCSSEPKVGQSSYTPKGTTRPPRGVVCKILRQSDKYFQR